MSVAFAEIDWRGRAVRIEHEWIARERAQAPLVVFLHEGLGSLAMWKDFPRHLCDAAGCRGLVYSRPGYGRSTPRAAEEAWGLDFMHRQAHEVLPALLQALGVANERIWLFGHSDGGSIALLYAAHCGAQGSAGPPQTALLPLGGADAAGRRPWGSSHIAGAIVVAPHIVVEDLSVASIEQARRAYRDTDLRQRLARYHDDPDSAFWGWNSIWLHPPFRAWSIEDEIAAIACPLLAVQGRDDEYGTLDQIRGIAKRVPQTQLLVLDDCGHSPQRDQPDALVAAAAAFIHGSGPPAADLRQV